MSQPGRPEGEYRNAEHEGKPVSLCLSQGHTLPGLPSDANGPVFRAPWEAQAFAMALALHERGVFTWPEWAAALTEAIRAAQAAGDADTGSTYYQHWLDALEALVHRKGLAQPEQLHALEHAWEAASLRTPHGAAIELTPQERALAHG